MIDWNKPIQTKSGHKAEFLRRLEGGLKMYRRVVVVTVDDDESAQIYTDEGAHQRVAAFDLVNVKPELPHNAKFKVAFALGFRVKFLALGFEFQDTDGLTFTAPSSQYSIHPDDAEAFEKIWAAIEAAR